MLTFLQQQSCFYGSYQWIQFYSKKKSLGTFRLRLLTSIFDKENLDHVSFCHHLVYFIVDCTRKCCLFSLSLRKSVLLNTLIFAKSLIGVKRKTMFKTKKCPNCLYDLVRSAQTELSCLYN